MKTIGIITFINTINYGAVLQAYALQKYLTNLGSNAEVIQYNNIDIANKENNIGRTAFSPKGILKRIVMGKALEKKKEAFKNFEDKYITTGMYLNTDNIFQVNQKYDYFVTGSDQVWNMSITKQDWRYYLDFVTDNQKKVAYAPSFGNSKYPDECLSDARYYLEQFKSLSIREKNGQDFLYTKLGLESMVVVDPTLLLDKIEWNEMAEFTPDIEHYILVYFPHNKKVVFEFVRELKRKTGLPVIYLSISPRVQFGVKTIYDASPNQFLGWIKNADYVVTGSFHGTAFSLNFGKQFYFEPCDESTRIGSITKLTGTFERSIANGFDPDKRIDYDRVWSILERERKKSKEWLAQAVELV